MSADDTRPDLAPLPSAADIVRYMRAAGWAHGRQGSHGAMWTKGDVEFSVPHEDDRPGWVTEALGRLAAAEGRSATETAAAVREHAAPLVMPPDEFAAVARTWRAWLASPAREAADRDALAASVGFDREQLGRIVREVWVATAREHPDPKPSWLVPWEDLGEWDKEVDRRIGTSVATHGAAVAAVEMHKLGTAEIETALARAEEAEAKLAAIAEYVRSRPSWVVDPVESRLRKDSILAIIGGEGADRG